jgi:hypothetical protein
MESLFLVMPLAKRVYVAFDRAYDATGINTA